MVEGMAAMAVLFLLLAVVVQAGFLVVARDAAQTAAAASARRGALEDAVPGTESERLRSEVEATIPGARDVEAAVDVHGIEVVAETAFTWLPPGPDLMTIRLRVRAVVPRVTPP